MAKCSGLFTLIEEILSRTVVEGLQDDEYFNALVDFRNVAEGDKNLFFGGGQQSVYRCRCSRRYSGYSSAAPPGGISEVSIPTSLEGCEDLRRTEPRSVSGRVDFNDFINKVSESFRQKLLNDIYTLWSGATANDFGGVTYFPAAGAYDEDELLDLIAC